MSITYNWVAPPIEQLSFSRNCELYGAWLAAFMSPDVWNQDYGWALGVNTVRSNVLLNSALPPGWPSPTHAQAANWWVEAYGADLNTSSCALSPSLFQPGTPCYDWRQHILRFENSLFTIPAQNCTAEMCKAMARTGNPDLAGIGITISYFIEAILVTMFFLAFALDSTFRKRWHRGDSNNNHTSNRSPSLPLSKIDYTIDIFRHTVKPFFQSAAFLSIAMLIASISTISTVMEFRAKLRKSQSYIPVLSNFYDVKLTLLSSLFCIFPVIILCLLSDQGKRGRVQRLIILLIAYIFCIALVFLSPKAEWDADVKLSAPIACDLRGGESYKAGLKALQGLIFVLPLTWSLCNFFIANPMNLKSLEGNKHLQRCRRYWRLVTGMGSLLAMWIFLGCFMTLRNEVLDVAGEMDNSNELAFGQVLALFAWGPVVLAMGSHVFFGSKVAYEMDLTSEYTVHCEEEKGDDREFLVYG